jgi:hypothetical protein
VAQLPPNRDNSSRAIATLLQMSQPGARRLEGAENAATWGDVAMDLGKTAQRLQIQRNSNSRCDVFSRCSATCVDPLQRPQMHRNLAPSIATQLNVATTCADVALYLEALRCLSGNCRNAWRSSATWRNLSQPGKIPLQPRGRQAVFSRSIATWGENVATSTENSATSRPAGRIWARRAAVRDTVATFNPLSYRSGR